MIIHGDCLKKLKELSEKSINMCMTSPPYWALRDYGVEGQLGLEPTFEEYINKLCDIFDEVKRVLRDDGTCWINIGDTYSSTRWTNDEDSGQPMNKFQDGHRGINPVKETGNIPDKCLVMIPFRFATEMVNRGWILRNTIIWYKPQCMPSSVKDRFTVDFEYLFFFSKKKKYYFETQYEPIAKSSMKDKRRGKIEYEGKWSNMPQTISKRKSFAYIEEGGRNKRTVWTINPKPFSEAHFAVYPEELCETPIKAGCPEFVCVKCGNPKIKVYERSKEIPILKADSDRNNPQGLYKKIGGQYQKELEKNPPKDLGYKPTCSCNVDFRGGIVLDPFFGAGTTGLVALKQNKKFVGIELNKEYIKIAEARIKPYLDQKKLN